MLSMKSLVCLSILALSLVAVSAGELQDAARAGDAARVRALLAANPAAINARVSGTTALHEAVRSGKIEVVRLLLASGADVNAADFSNLTPLKLALGYRQAEIAEALRQKGGLEKVAPVARTAPAAGAPAPSTPLFPGPGQSPRVGPSPAPAGPVPAQPPTTTTAASPNPAPALVITNKPVDEKEMMVVMFLIHDAARDGDVEKIKALFKNTPTIIEATDEKGQTPLHIAVRNHRTAAAQTLLALHANVNARSSSGQTPLHVAVREGDLEMTAFLLKNRADARARDNAGNSPLWVALQSPEAEAAAVSAVKGKAAEKEAQWAALLAREKRQFELAGLLVQAGADVKLPNRAGGLPLPQAVRLGNVAVVELLLKAGADLNAIEPMTGKAPLHLAASRADARIVEALLRNRAGVNQLDNRGETALCYAMREARTNSIAALRAAGGGLPRSRPLNTTEQSLVDAYLKNEAALLRAGNAEKGRIIIGMNPTAADCKRMFPRHEAAAWRVVAQLNKQIADAFSQPLFDAEKGREIWRVLPEPAAVMTREWQGRGWLASDLPVYSLTVEKVGSSTRPGEYVLVNGRWVLLPPLHRLAAEYASAHEKPAK